MPIDRPGFYPSITHADYLADPCPSPSLSASIAKLLVSASPAHAHAAHPKLGGFRDGESTDEQDTGTLMHALILGGGGPGISPVDAADWRTKAAKEAREAARAEGKVAVLAHKLERATRLADRVRFRLKERGVELDGQSEVTAAWQAGGAWCRGRLDHWHEKTATIYDLKYLASADPDHFARNAGANGYDLQRAAYVQAVETLRPDLAGRVRFVFIVAESSHPHPITLIEAGGSLRELGERRWKRALGLWSRCMADGQWPAYADGLVTVEAPEWALSQDLEKQLTEGGSSNVPF